ncbi:MAG: hypothetical protein H0W66_03800 [Chthoniobacterales bacterium]|nr:hypothetical protein [Chthoniobacterales bacterium]
MSKTLNKPALTSKRRALPAVALLFSLVGSRIGPAPALNGYAGLSIGF